MKHYNLKITESDLQAYVDGKLDESRAEQVAQYLAQHPLEEQRIAAYQQQNQLLHALYNKQDTDAPNRFRIAEPNARLKHSLAFLPYIASAASLFIGLVFGWVLNNTFNPQNTLTFSLPQTALMAHAVYSPEVRHPVEVGADQEAHLVKWLSKRLKREIKIPNLNPLGYTLVGGRLLPAQTGPAAQFMYENTEGNRLTLYIIGQSEKNKDTAFQFFERNNIKVFYWTDTTMGFALSGTTTKEQLLSAANKIYQELAI